MTHPRHLRFQRLLLASMAAWLLGTGGMPSAARAAELSDADLQAMREAKLVQRRMLQDFGERHERPAVRPRRTGRHGRGDSQRPARRDENGAVKGGRFAPESGRPGPSLQALAPNIRVNDPSGDDAFCSTCSDAAQSEPSIAALRNNVLVAWNDGLGFYICLDCATRQGYGYSTDGGATFVDGGMIPSPSGVIWTSDPVLAVNEATGDFYYCGLVDYGANESGLGVVRGQFSGNTFSWGTPVVVRHVVNQTGGIDIDKPWIAVDPGTGNVYVSYTHFTVNTQTFSVVDSIVFQRSLDRGATWERDLITLSSDAAAGLVQGSRPAVGPDGEVYVAWKEIGKTDADYMRIRKSTNHGASFGPEATVASFYDNFGTGAPGYNRLRGITFPSIAIGKGGSNRGRVYVTWNESVNWFDALRNLGNAGTTSETEPNDTPDRANPFVPGETLTGAFTAGNRNADFDFFSFSAVRGQTYVFRSYSASLHSLRVYCSDGITELALAGVDNPAVPASESERQGFITWTAPTTGTYYLRMRYVNVSSNNAQAPYHVQTGIDPPSSQRGRDERDVFVASSADGSNWSTPVRVNDDPPYFDDWLPEVVAVGDRVYVMWYDWRDTPPGQCGGASQIYVARSDDAGRTWASLGPATDRVSFWSGVHSNVEPNQGDYNAIFASAVSTLVPDNSDRLFVVWGDGRDANPNVFTCSFSLSQLTIAVVGSSADTNRVTVNWRVLDGGSGVSATVYRRIVDSNGLGTWVAVGSITSDANDRLQYQDTSVTQGVQYGYVLGFIQGGTERQLGETTVTVPRRGEIPPSTLALRGAVPNPAGLDILIFFTLPNAGPARLELWDIAGRIITRHDVGWQGAGEHFDALNDRTFRVRPGVYLVRLLQGGQSITKRVSVMP